MTHTPDLREFVAAWESLRLAAYDDGGGVWTIGYGHTLGVKPGDECTVEQAETWLDEELAEFGGAVAVLLNTPVEQHQYDALLSLGFNIGISALRKSTLLRTVNAGEHDAAIVQFLRWNKDNGRVLRGLLARRAGEGLMYGLGDYSGRG